jgi:putative ABC transport system ATP-binding protein
VANARAMVKDPVLILADEPTGNLDSKTEGEVLDIFDELNHEGVTIIMVTHDQHVAERCQRIIWLKDGIVDVELAGRTPQPA